jgi:hypothetical protein
MPEGNDEFIPRKRSLDEQCRWWESRLLEVANTLRREEERNNRTAVIGAALFLGELSTKIESAGD